MRKDAAHVDQDNRPYVGPIHNGGKESIKRLWGKEVKLVDRAEGKADYGAAT